MVKFIFDKKINSLKSILVGVTLLILNYTELLLVLLKAITHIWCE